MAELAELIAQTAAEAVETAEMMGYGALDYTPASLAVLEEVLAGIAAGFAELTLDQRRVASQQFGCYVLEVAHREFGGRYAWFEQRDQPLLVVGEPEFRVALIAWDKVLGRLSGDPADSIPFFYTGFAERVRRAVPGTDALYV
ncbi:Uncharacterized protein OS=Shewanella sp. HN-41 GN=SOHN41_03035 PE=4 SV=1 [Gemmataceae bacterium]|nr:Uncharacterized protein OS=Shewanella sp. HN-41 GN=SOHN41_03035 PE=4 SV=1 [Gemmataceae bacterium]VTT99054.1 Uncharacterized protein OS=Shewanella sp. HN-41 GN=SOHN41_03035 PE=4 SV=1 [Gemmataceae bacterium]